MRITHNIYHQRKAHCIKSKSLGNGRLAKLDVNPSVNMGLVLARNTKKVKILCNTLNICSLLDMAAQCA